MGKGGHARRGKQLKAERKGITRQIKQAKQAAAAVRQLEFGFAGFICAAFDLRGDSAGKPIAKGIVTRTFHTEGGDRDGAGRRLGNGRSALGQHRGA